VPAGVAEALIVASDPLHIDGAVTFTIGLGLIVITVVHVDELPQLFVTDQVIVEIPMLKIPLASLPVPVLIVLPDIEYEIEYEPPQLSDVATIFGTLNIPGAV
jgi:hypothetical protein